MLKTFLVEDEVVIREMIKKMIPWEQYGFELAGEASDGEMALPLILKSKPDLLITDIKMPFMDGLSLSRIVREELPRTKIIIISGYDDFEYAREAILPVEGIEVTSVQCRQADFEKLVLEMTLEYSGEDAPKEQAMFLWQLNF